MTVTYIDDFVFCPNPSLAEANDLVLAHHYSKRKASAPRYVGGLRDSSGQLVAACFFSQPPTRWSEPVLELSRLVRTPASKVPLTRLVAGCVRYIKQTGLCDLLVSFADNTQHHHGGVYQAASWNYHGARAIARRIYVRRRNFYAAPHRIRHHRHFWPHQSCRHLAADGDQRRTALRHGEAPVLESHRPVGAGESRQIGA